MSATRLAILLSALAAACGQPSEQGPDAPPDQTTPDETHLAQTSDLDSLLAHAEDVYFSGALDSANTLLTELRAVAIANADRTAEARAVTGLGMVARQQGRYAEAREIAQEGLTLKLEAGLDDQLARSFTTLGLIAYDQNRFTEASVWHRRADSIAQALGDDNAGLVAKQNIALPLIELGDFSGARGQLQQVRESAAALDFPRVEGDALINLGMLEIRLGDPVAGLQSLEAAIDRHRDIDHYPGVTNALGHMGTAYVALGEPATALSVLDSALALASSQGLSGEEASTYEIMAEVYRLAGDFQRAISLYDRAGELNARLGGKEWETGIDLRGQADIHARLGAYDRARELGERALALHREVDAPMEEMRDLLLLAEVSDLLEGPQGALAFLAEAREVATGLGAPIARVEVALAAGRIHDRHRRSNEVIQEIDRIKGDLPRGGYAAEWEAALLTSRAHLRSSDVDVAIVDGRRAVETVERVRGQFASSALRTLFGADKRDVYAQLIAALLRAGEIEEAFEVADGGRSRALLEQSTTVSAPPAYGSALDEAETLLRQLQLIEDQIGFYEDFLPPTLRTTEEQAEIDGMYGRLQDIRARFELLSVQRAESRGPAAALLGLRRTTTGEVRAALKPEERIVEFFVPDQGPVLAFVVTPTDVRVVETRVSVENLTSRVRLVRELIGRREAGDRLPVLLRALHTALIQPIVSAGMTAGVRELVIVPHDFLSYLPFAALLDETTGRYLVQDFDVSVLPSAAALPLLRGRPPSSGRGTSAFAPRPAELPATRAEVRAVARQLNGRSYQGRRASEAAVREALENSRIVHLATHGELNQRSPVFSRLTLAGGDGAPGDDGKLEVHELLGLRIRAELVFLSGCETGLGVAGTSAFAPGEDFATLSQAFLHAGARGVVATLWAVEDEAAADLATEFYARLEGRSPARALAEAQRAMLEREGRSAPYYWAAFQVAGIGPGRPQAAPMP